MSLQCFYHCTSEQTQRFVKFSQRDHKISIFVRRPSSESGATVLNFWRSGVSTRYWWTHMIDMSLYSRCNAMLNKIIQSNLTASLVLSKSKEIVSWDIVSEMQIPFRNRLRTSFSDWIIINVWDPVSESRQSDKGIDSTQTSSSIKEKVQKAYFQIPLLRRIAGDIITLIQRIWFGAISIGAISLIGISLVSISWI